MEHSKGPEAWKQIVLTLRCPYCVHGHDFRPMVELSGRPDGTFFCSKCHHVAGSSAETLKCGCANCRSLNQNSSQSAS